MMIRNLFLGLFLLGATQAKVNSGNQLRRLTPSDGDTFPGFCTTPTDEGCNDEWWHWLDPTVQECELAFGYGEEAWNGGALDVYAYVMWDMMSQQEQDCAEFYGWDQETWDADDADDTERRVLEETSAPQLCGDYPGEENCAGFWFNEISSGIQDCLVMFGVTEAIWNYAGHNDPTMFLYWIEMSDEQQDCAGTLGYDQESWDAE